MRITLPIRQIEFLQALNADDPVVKNAATRMALRQHGLITTTDDWDQIELTDKGIQWLLEHENDADLGKTMIEISAIRRDGGTQSRVGTYDEVVYEYASLMKDGVEFPPVSVFYDGTDYWLADGFHRVAAARSAGLKRINAVIQQGSQRDAVLASVGANSNHGLRRTNGDKRRAVQTLLNDSEWSQWSDREIARRCGVSAPTVGAIRKELSTSGVKDLHLGERKGADGKTYTVKHWGLSNGMAFWMQVAKFNLDKSTILDAIQPGATLLTDLTMSKEDCWRRLDQLASERTASLFPQGSIVKHTTGRFGQVIQAHPTTIRVMDFRTGGENQWHMDDTTLSSREAWEAAVEAENAAKTGQQPDSPAPEQKPLPSQQQNNHARIVFEVGDLVKIPSGHQGIVTNTDENAVMVETRNGIRPYNRAFLTLIKHFNPEQHNYAVSLLNPNAESWFERILGYTTGDIIATYETRDALHSLITWLEGIEGVLESDLKGELAS